MPRTDVRDELQDGMEPAHMAVGPDGGAEIRPLKSELPPRPRLCEAGPCRNYHRFAVQMDAAAPLVKPVPAHVPTGTPRTELGPRGAMYRPLPVFHTQVHHYCYPSLGVETVLGDMPVTECNRWDPVEPPKGYQEALEAWEAAYAAAGKEAEEAEGIIHAALVEEAAARCRIRDAYYYYVTADGVGRCYELPDVAERFDTPEASLEWARTDALERLAQMADQGIPYPAPSPVGKALATYHIVTTPALRGFNATCLEFPATQANADSAARARELVHSEVIRILRRLEADGQPFPDPVTPPKE